MLLSHSELSKLLDAGVISGSSQDKVNSTSIDITLGRHVLVEVRNEWPKVVSLRSRSPIATYTHDLRTGPLKLQPGEFVLAHSVETFDLPLDISAEYKLKSSMARVGLNHLNAGWCDAGWNGSVLTLELVNVTRHHTLELHEGDRIGQMVFFRHAPVPYERSYAARGRYNQDSTVEGVKL